MNNYLDGEDVKAGRERHSASQVLSQEDLKCGDFLYLYEKGVPKKLVKVIGVDFLGEKLTVEWAVGSTIFTKNLEFSEHSLVENDGDNWLETVPNSSKTGFIWKLKRFIAKPFDPDKIDPDYFP